MHAPEILNIRSCEMRSVLDVDRHGFPVKALSKCEVRNTEPYFRSVVVNSAAKRTGSGENSTIIVSPTFLMERVRPYLVDQ